MTCEEISNYLRCSSIWFTIQKYQTCSVLSKRSVHFAEPPKHQSQLRTAGLCRGARAILGCGIWSFVVSSSATTAATAASISSFFSLNYLLLICQVALPRSWSKSLIACQISRTQIIRGFTVSIHFIPFLIFSSPSTLEMVCSAGQERSALRSPAFNLASGACFSSLGFRRSQDKDLTETYDKSRGAVPTNKYHLNHLSMRGAKLWMIQNRRSLLCLGGLTWDKLRLG